MGSMEEPTPEFTLDTGFYYRLYNKGTGNAIDVLDNEEDKVCTWSPARERETQQWEILAVGEYYQVVNRESGLALYDCAVKEGDIYKTGTQLELRKPRSSQHRQQWSFVPVNTETLMYWSIG